MCAQSTQSDDGSIFADLDAEENEGGDGESRVSRRVRMYRRALGEQWAVLRQDSLVVASMFVMGFFILMAIVAPFVAPYGQTERLTSDDGTIAQWEEPSLLGGEGGHLLGTTAEGYDLFSQLLYGSRAALLVGLLAAVFVAGIGTMVGLVSGYYGGRIDDALMRFVDFMYGLPLLPTVILLVALAGPSLVNLILAIIVLQWRTTARVIRSQALSLRERPFVKAAKVAGASDRHIILKHLAPNVLPLTFLYGAFSIAWAILTEAGVAFLGLGDPNHVSWGTMLQSARSYDAMVHGAWWWFLPPGICIALVVISGFLIGRGYEEITNPELQE